jgi:multidrug efflux pump
VLTISISLVAVFIPLLLMGGIVGRLLREFSITLSIAIGISMVISLTTTPMMCAHLLRREPRHGRLYEATERGFNWMVDTYGRTLTVVLRHSFVTLLVLLAAIALNVYLFLRIPKGFFPIQDTGRINGNIQADQAASFQQMDRMLKQYVGIVAADPAVDSVIGFTGGGRGGATNTSRMFIQLKPLDERAGAQQVVTRLRPKLASVPGGSVYVQPTQDLRVGGRQTNAEYQFTMQGDNVADLNQYGPRMLDALRGINIITDVNTDLEDRGLEAMVEYDRNSAARFGISSQLIDNILYDAFGQRLVSTMYTPLNQYYVVMEAAPQYWQNPDILKHIYVQSPNVSLSSSNFYPNFGQVPLAAFAHFAPQTTAILVNHQGLFPSVTISFDLLPGTSLGQAVDAIQAAAQKVRLPMSIKTFFAGTAETYQQSLESEPMLIAAALIAVYLVLGILYESYVHPVTILSTLPSAGVGAMLALLITRTDLTIIAMIGIILLIGIVKKNAILMIDFALAVERNEGKNSRDSIYEACMLRFRPIMMTTMAALLGAVPLAFGTGMGSELRRPLGISIIGGLIVSQMLTLYTTPVVYLYFDRIQRWVAGLRTRPVGPLPSEG